MKKAVTIDDGMSDLGERLNRDVAYTKGRRDANSENLDDLGKPLDERQPRFDERTEQRTDEALNKEWDDAFKQSSDKFKSQSWALTDEDTDAWRSELLRTIDVLRRRGFSDADILNTIKGN